ncbi:MAG: helix-turn-helix transcriptional regulator [Spirochaetes bacterium]|nr:helix-turn-helix transcriptional regulator [Spirochaetota bacterium]
MAMNETRKLTARQQQVLSLYITGITYREIATQLGVSPHTVRRHIEQIYKRVKLPHNDKYTLRSVYAETGS